MFFHPILPFLPIRTFVCSFILFFSICTNSQSLFAIEKTKTESEKIIFSPQETNNKLFNAFITAGASATTNNQVPFWLRTMQNGANPVNGLSGLAFGGVTKNYSGEINKKLFDWGMGAEMGLYAGSDFKAYFTEAYIKGRIGYIQIQAGRAKEIIGLVDSTLSSGAFSVSGNALGIPQISLSTPSYWNVPFTDGLIAFKASFAHGWMGDRISNHDSNSYKTYYHHKSLYGRLGKKHWKVKLYGGFNHQVMWGSEQEMFADYGLSVKETYKYVFLGKAYATNVVPASKVGNHIGSIDQALEIQLDKIKIFAYHQFFYEAGALAKLANIKDGLTGVSFTNTQNQTDIFQWNKLVVEFLFSKSHGAEIDSPLRPSAVEDYYHNYQYIEGWIYDGEMIGNNLITQRKYTRNNLPVYENFNIANNRVVALHIATDINIGNWRMITKLTTSNNFGTWWVSPVHRGLMGSIIYHDPPYFGNVWQFSGYIEASRSLRKNIVLDIAIANDTGGLLYNSSAVQLKLSKYW